ncbi:MAG: hypothetical protein K6U87_11285 [Firmicutes bacterium]|nr:hypothetical protein [Bacillota bacterium]
MQDFSHDGEILEAPITAPERFDAGFAVAPPSGEKALNWAIRRTAVRKSTSAGGGSRRRVWAPGNAAHSEERKTVVQGAFGCSRAI